MRFYNKNRPIISYALPSTKLGCICIAIALLSVIARGIGYFISFIPQGYIITYSLINQARLMWDSDKLKDFNNGRVYNAGDAWFSSTDGKHDNVSYVHFPNMKFKVYAELGRLLNEYYS